MPCYLGEYIGCATNRSEKFSRAVQSFINQDYENKELIIISDGCEITNTIYKEKYSHFKYIKLISIPKQPFFSGNVREAGLIASYSDIITYLDSDDYYKNTNHLSVIVSSFKDENIDWVYFNDYVKYFHIDHLPIKERNAELKQGNIGTSNIAHRNLPYINWENKSGYGHDFTFINSLIKNYGNRYTKIDECSYIVCHIPESCDT